MHHVLLIGAGKIGRMIASFLSHTPDYVVAVADADPEALARIGAGGRVKTALLDASSPTELARLMHGQHAVISALSYSFNPAVAHAALAAGVSYFDLTEDIA